MPDIDLLILCFTKLVQITDLIAILKIYLSQISKTWFYIISSNTQLYIVSCILVVRLCISRDELLFNLYFVIGHS